jgi:hypothetical protein
VGNGTAVVLKNGIRTALIGCGGDYYAAGSICSQLRSSYSETDLLLVPRDESTESSAYPELCSKINADTKLVSSDFYGSLLHRSGEKAVDSASLTLWDKVLIEYTDSDSLCAAYVSINGCGVLISFMPANDISQMPQKWQDASILVCRQALPEGARDYGFPAIIISGDEEKGFSSYKNYLAEDIGNAYLTAEHGDIEITNLSAKSFTVWSEF